MRVETTRNFNARQPNAAMSDLLPPPPFFSEPALLGPLSIPLWPAQRRTAASGRPDSPTTPLHLRRVALRRERVVRGRDRAQVLQVGRADPVRRRRGLSVHVARGEERQRDRRAVDGQDQRERDEKLQNTGDSKKSAASLNRVRDPTPDRHRVSYHGPQANDLYEAVDDLGHGLCDDAGPALHNGLLGHALLPQGALAFHGRQARLGLAPVIDVRLGAREDGAPELERERGEALLDVVVKRVEEENDEGEKEKRQEQKRRELEVTAMRQRRASERGPQRSAPRPLQVGCGQLGIRPNSKKKMMLTRVVRRACRYAATSLPPPLRPRLRHWPVRSGDGGGEPES